MQLLAQSAYVGYLLILASLPAILWWRWGWKASLLTVAIEIALIFATGFIINLQIRSYGRDMTGAFYVLVPLIAALNGLALTAILAMWRRMQPKPGVVAIIGIISLLATYALHIMSETPYLFLLIMPGPAIIVVFFTGIAVLMYDLSHPDDSWS